VLGVAAPYAMGNVLLTMLGQNDRDTHVRGPGHGSIPQAFHVVTFVIYRNGAPPARHIVFKMGQAGNGEKP